MNQSAASGAGNLRQLARAYAEGSLTLEAYRRERTNLLVQLTNNCDTARHNKNSGSNVGRRSAAPGMGKTRRDSRTTPGWLLPAVAVAVSVLVLVALLLWGDSFNMS